MRNIHLLPFDVLPPVDTPDDDDERFLEQYDLAFRLAQELDLRGIKDAAPVIQEAVHDNLGEGCTEIDILVVSALTAEAKERALRRPVVRNERELRREQWNLWPQNFFKSVKKQRQLLREQAASYEQQSACIIASSSFRTAIHQKSVTSRIN